MGSGGSKDTDTVEHSDRNRSVRSTTGGYNTSVRSQHEEMYNNNTRNSNTKFVNKKENDDITKDLDLDSSWKTDTNNSRTENNNRERQMNNFNTQKNALPPRLPPPPQENPSDYPETYAQKNLREQYTKQALLRQKTIYRDPDEWDVEDQESLSSFDVSKFKAANNSQSTKKNDIFTMTPEYTKNIHQTDNSDDYYQQPTYNKRKSVPRYDISEEELMADIEKEYL